MQHRDLESVDQLLDLLRRHGDSQYGGEAVTQLEHALQTAWLAEQHQASDALIAAALLHDVGHLLHQLPDDAPDRGVDDRHEAIAGRALRRLFPEEVLAPIRLHVEAKRYLCAVESEYLEQLSPPSQTSLRLQGGPMQEAEAREFARGPHAEAAVLLRRWDDLAKTPDLQTPPLDHFAERLRRAAKPGDG